MMSEYAKRSDCVSIRSQVGIAEADGVFIDARRLFAVLFDYVTVGGATSSDVDEVCLQSLGIVVYLNTLVECLIT